MQAPSDTLESVLVEGGNHKEIGWKLKETSLGDLIQWIDAHPDALTRRFSSGRQLIHQCCASGNMALVRHLVEELSVDIEARDYFGTRPLHVAAWISQPDIVDYLLERNACPDPVNDNFETPLQNSINTHWTPIPKTVSYCMKGGAVYCLHRCLMDRAKSLNEKQRLQERKEDAGEGPKTMNDLLDVAEKHDLLRIANGRIFPCSKTRYLHAAALSGNLECVKYLVELGVSITEKDESEMNPFHHAADSANPFVVEYLLTKVVNDEQVNSVVQMDGIPELT
eukprot:TRINITY_DN13144_c0_g1_i2.p1 TRINITY_DN13144_c0_g1~~TRINITY_DN13144_c0_g1_i2.p1  ORF type:complete len:281 (+),score=43.34 TRINITY_DN13144_c0_g1_i2:87-929(+)